MQKQIKLFGLTISLVSMFFIGAGCSDVFSFVPKSKDTGVYKSEDGGTSFVHKNVLSGKSNTSFTSKIQNVVALESDSKVLFAGSKDGGIFKSDNGGDSWQNIFAGIEVVSFDVHPTDPSIIFVAGTVNEVSKVYRTINGGTDWAEVYIEAKPENPITVLKIDKSSPNFVYVAFEKGAIIKSSDGGDKWEFMSIIRDGVFFLEIHPQKPGVVYAATPTMIYISTDGGRNFVRPDIVIDARNVRALKLTDIEINPNNGDEIYIGGVDRIIYSVDGGANWNKIEVISQVKKTPVLSMRISKLNPNKIFYASGSVIYRSDDKGKTWRTLNIPVGRVVSSIVLDRENDDIIYVGME
jgi:photosystem II stability/assembly factor-like uncharacterized protein